ncbi:MAG: thymidine phosphorylase, partial [Actinomycetota bacterium]|nr:thymidine phosphorylase [Actinomycetota bacterium]
VGLSEIAAPGERVGESHPLAMIHARDEDAAHRAVAALAHAYRIGDRAGDPEPAVREVLG